MRYLLILICFSLTSIAFAQQNMRVSDVINAPGHPSSVLEVESTTKGMLVPRMTTAQRLAITNPANGLLVYDTNVECFMYYTAFNTTWNYLCNTGNGGANTILTTPVAAGANCANGGVLLQFGNDANGNGVLDATEINPALSQYVCNGVAGPQGAQGIQGPQGVQGPQGPSWNITNLTVNQSGQITLTTDQPQTFSTTTNAWLTTGNTGTVPATNFLGTIDNQDLVFRTNNTEKARVTAGGFVGIGISTPITKLHVEDGIVLANNSLGDKSAMLTNDGGVELYRSPTTAIAQQVSGYIDFKDVSTDDYDFRIFYSNPNFTTANGGLIFESTTNGTPATALRRMIIKNDNGYIGMGTMTPQRPLEVNFDQNLGHIQAMTGGLRLRNTNTATCNTDKSWDFRIGNCGQMGITTYNTNGSPNFNILKNDAPNDNSTPSAGPVVAINTSAPINSLSLTANGNVGIGTAAAINPAALDVTATNKGVIFPRVPLTGATDAVTVPGVSDGILVYNTSITGTGQNAINQGYYYWQTNRWNKLQTSAYSGVIFGVHNPTTPNHVAPAAGQWQNTGAYIDLPPGKWVVYIYELVSPNNNGNQQWDGSERALWVRTSLSNSNTTYSSSPQIVGSPLASGSVTTPSNFGMISGAIYVNNTTGATTRYYMWANVDRYGGTNCGLFNFATTSWGENQFFAVPAE
jgi:hypothetical protein